MDSTIGSRSCRPPTIVIEAASGFYHVGRESVLTNREGWHRE
ncbi:MAG TPA: hypothetical protein VJ695_06845 [Nitrososphaera sp.]|nr:hypothetical protein [Nitrososphaera sp.]